MSHVSICIPAYRQVSFLKETLCSIQKQKFDDYEVIISDDSPDDAVEKLVSSFNFGSKLIYTRNSVALGSPENWNAAVASATGSLIKLMHHDDRFACESALGDFVQMLDAHPDADFAFGASLVESSATGRHRIHRPSEKQVLQLVNLPELLFFGNFIGAPSATIYRNGLGVDYDRRMKWLVDIDFYIRILKLNPNFVYSENVLVATTTDADHQITKICQNDIETDFIEYVRLYCKLADKIRDDLRTWQVWFRLFEKYQVYSQNDLERLGDRLTTADYALLTPFLIKYHEKRLQRSFYRLYARLPLQFKAVLTSLRRMRYL